MGHKSKHLRKLRANRFVVEGGGEGVALPTGTSLVFRIINGVWWGAIFDKNDNRIHHAANFELGKVMEALVTYVGKHPSEVRRAIGTGGKLDTAGGSIGPVAAAIIAGATFPPAAGVDVGAAVRDATELVGVYANNERGPDGSD